MLVFNLVGIVHLLHVNDRVLRPKLGNMKKSASVNVKFAKKYILSKITGKVRIIGLSDFKCYKLIDIPCIKKQFLCDYNFELWERKSSFPLNFPIEDGRCLMSPPNL